MPLTSLLLLALTMFPCPGCKLLARFRGGDPGPPITLPAPPRPAPGPACLTTALRGSHQTYDVGPGRKYTDLGDVPWLSLTAGDVVNIYYRPAPYRTKIGLRAAGTAEQPVVLNGVTGPGCERPVIDGRDALTPKDEAKEKYFNEKYAEFLALIYIYRGPNDPYAYKPRHIQIRNLKLTGAAKGNHYTGQSGARVEFAGSAGGVFAIVVEDLLVDNCEITGNGNGVFVNSRNDGEEDTSRRVTIRNSLVYGNGQVGSYTEHNLYIQAARATYEGNYIGQLVKGAEGSSLKDRSSGTIVRFNRIDAASRALDLVETEESPSTVFVDPEYHSAWVYGNLIISDTMSELASSSLLIHWGGDNTRKYFRTGTLYFYYNTVVTRGTKKSSWHINLFDMPTPQQRVEARGNIFRHLGNSHLQLTYESGRVDLVGTNWIQSGWEKSTGKTTVPINVSGKLIEGDDPGFRDLAAQDFSLAPGAAALDAGDAAPPAGLAGRWIDRQYRPGAAPAPRVRGGAAYDLGAFESN